MNCWLFDASVFQLLEEEFNCFLEGNRDHSSAEFYLPAAIQKGLSSNRASVHVHPTSSQWCGLTYAEDRPEVQNFLMELTNKGVYPNQL